MRPLAILAAAMAASALALGPANGPASAPAGPHRLITLQGQALSGTVKSVTTQSVKFAAGGKDESINLDEVRMIQLAGASDRMGPGQRLLRLQGGQAILIDGLDMAGGKLKISSALAGPMTVDLSAVRTIVLPDEKSLPLEVLKEFAALNLSKASQDYLLAVDKKGQAAPYAGIFKGISGGKVSFELDGAERTIDLASVRLIELANTLGGEKPRGEIILTDGSAIPFAQIALGSGRWTIGHPRLSVSPLEEAKVAEVRIFSDKLAYLSDLQPVRQEQVGMFDAGVGFVRDRSTTGGPIRLGGVTYSRGLGLHSRCVLTYQLDGKYSTFLAKAGIDDAAARAGKAVLTVSADGKKLLDAQALSADQSGMDLRLDVKGAKELTILVEFPPDGLDVGGHVDLADAILVQ